jgi:adenine-specific DNA-methyltransferase
VHTSNFLAFVRSHSARILAEAGGPLEFCSALATGTSLREITLRAQQLLPQTRDQRDYTISTAYALLIGRERRKRLSAYFTPPALAEAAVHAAATFLSGRATPRALDPACGGGSFLGPMLRALVARECEAGRSAQEACHDVLAGLRGIEIDPGLARLSSLLLRERLRADYDYVQPGAGTVATAALRCRH